MRKIILTKGLPGSGKTTWAKQYQKEHPNTVLVNKDDLRDMLHQGIHSKGREKFVLKIRDAIVIQGLERGHDVVVHDTNFHPKHESQMRIIADMPAWKDQCEVVIQDFTNVPLEECIKRDLKRERSVGERAIRQMYNEYLKPKSPTLAYAPELPNVIICDIDGTLALFSDANPYERDFLKDEVNIPVKNILDKFPQKEIILFSGRMDKFREQTVQWLRQNDIHYSLLAMRKTGDLRKDFVIKQELFNEHIKGKYNVQFVLDDRDQVVAYWRSIGLTCLQVDYGAF